MTEIQLARLKTAEQLSAAARNKRAEWKDSVKQLELMTELTANKWAKYRATAMEAKRARKLCHFKKEDAQARRAHAVRLLRLGYSDREIARAMRLSFHTVKAYIRESREVHGVRGGAGMRVRLIKALGTGETHALPKTLTPAEMRVARIVCEGQGYSNKDIAGQLHTTETVIKNYLHLGVYPKTGVWSRAELVSRYSAEATV